MLSVARDMNAKVSGLRSRSEAVRAFATLKCPSVAYDLLLLPIS